MQLGNIYSFYSAPRGEPLTRKIKLDLTLSFWSKHHGRFGKLDDRDEAVAFAFTILLQVGLSANSRQCAILDCQKQRSKVVTAHHDQPFADLHAQNFGLVILPAGL